MKCTINDIAKELNMSRNTVSKALNGKAGITEQTRQIILQKAKEMNYRTFEKEPHNILAAPSKGNIVFLTKASFNYSEYWVTVMKGIESVLSRNGYQLILGIMDEDDMHSLRFPAALSDPSTKGIILVEICDHKVCTGLQSFGLPLVTIDMPRDYEAIIDKMDIITMENKRNVRKLTRMFFDSGKRNFAFIGDIYSDNVGLGVKERYDALKETLEQAGCKLNMQASLLYTTEKELMNFSQLVSRLKAIEAFPQVFFCENDWAAIQVMHALQFLGYSIPKDVSVVGFDNIISSAKTTPPLTTIDAPKEQLGKAAASTILERISNPELPYVLSQYSTKLILRGSANLE